MPASSQASGELRDDSCLLGGAGGPMWACCFAPRGADAECGRARDRSNASQLDDGPLDGDRWSAGSDGASAPAEAASPALGLPPPPGPTPNEDAFSALCQRFEASGATETSVAVADDKTAALRTSDSWGRSPSPPAGPDTPSPRASHVGCRHSLSSASTMRSGGSAAPSAAHSAAPSEGVLSASSLPRPDSAKLGRPQPVHELQALLFAGQSAAAQRSWNGPQLPGPKVSAGGSSAKSRSSTAASAGEPPSTEAGKGAGRVSWLRRAASRGCSVNGKQAGAQQPPGGLTPASSVEIEGLQGPFDAHGHYRVLRQLSPGASGTVWHCMDMRGEEEVAIKLMPRSPATARAAMREVGALRLCALHPFIISLREVFLTDSCLAMVFEYAAGGDLADYIKTYQSAKRGRGLSEERTRWIIQQLIVAVDFCHKQGIANRDIKPENVLLVPAGPDPSQSPVVKLCDFGFAKDERADSVCKTACGTLECVAPEVLAGGSEYDGKASDIWSLGVLLYNMLTGGLPFSRPEDERLGQAGSMTKLFQRIATAQYPRPSHLSRPALDLLGRMLQRDPAARISIDGLKQHPWFGGSLQSLASSTNKGLLAMPDAMLTAFANQDDSEIEAILREAMHCDAPARLL